jgi:hypothetical protein
MDARNVDRPYHGARQRLGLTSVPWHFPWHFGATALLEAGEDLFVVSRIRGHTSVARLRASTATCSGGCSKRRPIEWTRYSTRCLDAEWGN